MKNDSRSLWPAKVDLEKVRYSKGTELGIDFSNQIDAWNKMEFKFSHQIKQLQDGGFLRPSCSSKENRDLRSLVYSIRERVE